MSAAGARSSRSAMSERAPERHSKYSRNVVISPSKNAFLSCRANVAERELRAPNRSYITEPALHTNRKKPQPLPRTHPVWS